VWYQNVLRGNFGVNVDDWRKNIEEYCDDMVL